MAQIDKTNIANASIATPASGVTSTFIETTTKRIATKDDTGAVRNYATLEATETFTGVKTLTTPVIGAATGTSVVLTGAITSNGTAGIGYATGAGGTVTQITSRVTGVTLSKLTGAITLFSAAGQTTYQTFTVTNTTIAATDTVIVNQKSGTDLMILLVTNIAAGSFKISFATTGGTTVESPVIQYTIIKSVNA